MDAPPTRGSDSFGSLWQSSGRPLRFRRQLSLPNLFTKRTDALAHEWPSLRLCSFPPVALLPAGTQMSQGKMAQAYSNSPPSGGSNRGCWESFQLLKAAPWPIPLRRNLLSQANGTIWHPRPKLWTLHVWPLDGSLSSSQSVS